MIFLAVIAIAIAHSAANPIHYLPFVALGKARGWSLGTTSMTAVLASAGHLVGFAAAVIIGFAAGKGIHFAEDLLHTGADFGMLIFLAFGIAYMGYGIWRALKNNPCEDSCNACRDCGHGHERVLKNADPQSPKYALLLFLMFALGPCNAILALVAYYAASYSATSLTLLALTYYAATALTMALCTALLYKGLELFSFGTKFVDRWAHAISGAVITASVAIAMLLEHSHSH